MAKVGSGFKIRFYGLVSEMCSYHIRGCIRWLSLPLWGLADGRLEVSLWVGGRSSV